MVSQGKKILFIINKRSGVGFHVALEGKIMEACKKNGAICTIEYTQRRGHAISLASDASRNGVDYVVAVGGDGTINEVSQGLLNTSTPMGILPRGSGNGLARYFGIPTTLTLAVDNLFSNKIIRMDTMTVNNKVSLNVSGIGFDGHIANLFADRKIRGLVGYVRLTLRELFRFQEFEVSINIAGRSVSQKAFIIAIANSSQYGNNVRIAPLASVCDGLIDLSIMKKVPWYNFGFIYSFLRGRLKNSPMCEMMKVKEVNIKTKKPVAYHIDGEPCGLHDTFTVKLNPASLSILVPEAFWP